MMEYNIGEKILQKRQNKQMTQEEFAGRLGVTPQAVSKWERGQGLPETGMLSGICQILGMDANELLDVGANSNVVGDNHMSRWKTLQESMIAEPLVLEIGEFLIPSIEEGLNTTFIHDQRKKLVEEYGLLMPVLRIKDNVSLIKNEYRILVYDKEMYRGVYNENSVKEFQGMILCTIDICIKQYEYILNKNLVKIMMDNMKSLYPGVIDDIVPQRIDYMTIKKILIGIIASTGNIRNMVKIMELVEEEMLINHNQDIKQIVNRIISVL